MAIAIGQVLMGDASVSDAQTDQRLALLGSNRERRGQSTGVHPGRL